MKMVRSRGATVLVSLCYVLVAFSMIGLQIGQSALETIRLWHWIPGNASGPGDRSSVRARKSQPYWPFPTDCRRGLLSGRSASVPVHPKLEQYHRRRKSCILGRIQGRACRFQWRESRMAA